MENDKIYTNGTVERSFSYGKCGFIRSILGITYYFSPESFKGKPRRLQIGESVTFLKTEEDGKRIAKEIE